MKRHVHLAEIILYVKSQENSAAFYQSILREPPVLNVPGITEFLLNDNCKLGLMSNNNIAEILGGKIIHPAKANGIPRCELYLYVNDVHFEFSSAINNGATLISPLQLRPWGDKACYFSDPDGHIIAFAENRNKSMNVNGRSGRVTFCDGEDCLQGAQSKERRLRITCRWIV